MEDKIKKIVDWLAHQPFEIWKKVDDHTTYQSKIKGFTFEIYYSDLFISKHGKDYYYTQNCIEDLYQKIINYKVKTKISESETFLSKTIKTLNIN